MPMTAFRTVLAGTLLLLAACSKPDYLTLDGEQGSLQQLRDQWLVINYWASWCKPCRDEIPELNAFSKRSDEQRVLAVNFDGLQGEELRAAVEDMGIAFDSLLADPATLLGYPRPIVLPTTVIVAPGGKPLHILRGPQSRETLAAAIEEVARQLGKTSEAPNG